MTYTRASHRRRLRFGSDGLFVLVQACLSLLGVVTEVVEEFEKVMDYRELRDRRNPIAKVDVAG